MEVIALCKYETLSPFESRTINIARRATAHSNLAAGAPPPAEQGDRSAA
jgi:hypothetical protein